MPINTTYEHFLLSQPNFQSFLFPDQMLQSFIKQWQGLADIGSSWPFKNRLSVIWSDNIVCKMCVKLCHSPCTISPSLHGTIWAISGVCTCVGTGRFLCPSLSFRSWAAALVCSAESALHKVQNSQEITNMCSTIADQCCCNRRTWPLYAS